MKYQETGRFGRITKHLRKQGHEDAMPGVLHDSIDFPKLRKPAQAKYVETVVGRMAQRIGTDNAEKVLFECGAQCCGKPWTAFSRRIWEASSSMDDFIANLNREEAKYNTSFSWNPDERIITVQRSKCICGLINKGIPFADDSQFCKCSNGHMHQFFSSIFEVESITLLSSISTGDSVCKWHVVIKESR